MDTLRSTRVPPGSDWCGSQSLAMHISQRAGAWGFDPKFSLQKTLYLEINRQLTDNLVAWSIYIITFSCLNS